MLFMANMNIFSTLTILITMMATTFSRPTCDPKCKPTNEYCQPDFIHVSELGSSSVAPWDLSIDTKAGREPQHIQYAECKGCTEKNMTAKPIVIQVSVYEPARNGSWCKCPFKLAVGCTCVRKQ